MKARKPEARDLYLSALKIAGEAAEGFDPDAKVDELGRQVQQLAANLTDLFRDPIGE